MGQPRDVVTSLHKSTKRDYIARMLADKVSCSAVAREYGRDYWDGDRKFGYGGYYYDGRWEGVARKLIDLYELKGGCKILDVGCGKGYLLYELKKLLPEAMVAGFDVSGYAIDNSKEEIRNRIFVHRAQDRYPFKDGEFDLVISITTLHNLPVGELKTALGEIERVGKNKYIVVESYRNTAELFNLQCWALTCESFFSRDEWLWLFKEFGYTGDHEFIYFE